MIPKRLFESYLMGQAQLLLELIVMLAPPMLMKRVVKTLIK
jgi:hypothetical protein